MGPILEYSRLGLEGDAGIAEVVGVTFEGGVAALAARGKRDWRGG